MDIRDIISLLTVFDIQHYGPRSHPIIAYSSKAQCLKRFDNSRDAYRKIYPLASDILELWDKIHQDFPE